MKLDKSYINLIDEIKSEIKSARIRAHLAVNKELIILYWKIGKRILEEQEKQGWGAKVIENISKDLLIEFPEMRGLSSVNIKRMRQFADQFNYPEIGSQLVTQLPWGHIQEIMFKIKSTSEREWYIQKTIENGWSRNVLVHQIESGLYSRQGNAITNFSKALPASQSDLAHQLIKSPYNLEFLNIESEVAERKLEEALVLKIRDFLLELGTGFAFIGNQYHIELGGKDYYIDLLFYHVKLHCYVVIELKAGEFQPEFAGKLNFYINVVDDKLKTEGDNPTIGLILCKSKSGIEVEYSLKGLQAPMGVSEYQLSKILPKEMEGKLPSPKEINDTLEINLLRKSA